MKTDLNKTPARSGGWFSKINIWVLFIFIILGLYYFGLFNLYDYTAWLRIIVIAFIIFLLRFIYNRMNSSENKFHKIDINSFNGWMTFLPLKMPKSPKKTVKPTKKVWKSENKCRTILEKIYNAPFKSCRPDFLRNPKTKRNLELDCYNKDLKIALEYQGQQHFNHTPAFQKSKKQFYGQVFRDDFKKKKCMQKGIRLIEVPYWILEDKLEDFIITELKKKKCL